MRVEACIIIRSKFETCACACCWKWQISIAKDIVENLNIINYIRKVNALKIYSLLFVYCRIIKP